MVGSPCSSRDSEEFYPTPQLKSINSLALIFLYSLTLTSIHDYWKNRILTIWTFVNKVMSVLFSTLSRFAIAFFPRSVFYFPWLQLPSAVILEPEKRKSGNTISTFSPSICHEVMGLEAMIFVSGVVSFKPAFSLSSFISIKRLFSPSSLFAIRVVSSAYLRLLIFLLAILIPAVIHPAWHFSCLEVSHASKFLMLLSTLLRS